MKYIDMHVHSTYSDGMCTPKQLVKMAQEKGLKAIALTDHDTVAGIKEAAEAAKGTSVELIPGIEVSADYQGKEIHILGYRVDIHNEEFLNRLKCYQQEREKRNDQMIELMVRQGIDITKEKMDRRFPDAVLTRANFAAFLVEEGYCQDKDEAFKVYLNEGCPCYLPKKRISSKEAMECIQIAGGHPVLAHLVLYHMNRLEKEELVRYLIPLGLEGIEAIYSNNSLEEEDYLKGLADKFHLYITGGSDYHGSIKPSIQMGTGKGNLKVPEELLWNIK